GYVNHEDLPALYRSATTLVYPSIFEGFGLPPLEAMACGTPVITSKTSSLPEVVGDAGLLINPQREIDIAEAILQVTSNDQMRAEMREAGLAQAARFSWRNTAQKTLQVYRKVATASFNKFVAEISGQDLP
ncbi:MAG TPA: glycosyltransferase family 1 protein, partial [Blastocatellia bacterium]|nr:glycosyltransferase family 1 protein [Blastocatellia bacterium]